MSLTKTDTTVTNIPDISKSIKEDTSADGFRVYVDGQLTIKSDTSHLHSQYAPLSSPDFQGTPLADSPLVTDNSRRVATTSYVRSYTSSNYLPLTGGTLSNFLTLHADPTSNMHAATKKYVDDALLTVAGSSGGNTLLATYTTPGTYTVMLYGGNEACMDTAVAELSVDYCPEANFTIQANNNNVFFYGTPTNTVSYNWNFGDGTTASVSSYNVFHQYAANGTYNAILTVSNVLGCTATDTVQFTIIPTGISGVDVERALVYNQLENVLLVSSTSKDILHIYDASGKQVQQYAVSTEGEKLYLGLLPKGAYIARVEKQQAYIKFVR